MRAIQSRGEEERRRQAVRQVLEQGVKSDVYTPHPEATERKKKKFSVKKSNHLSKE